MRIAMVTDWFWPRLGGIESHVLGLAEDLTNLGHQTVVYTSFPGPEVFSTVPVTRVNCRFFPFSKLAVPFGLVRDLTRILKDGNFDVVHIHASVVPPFCLAALAAANRLDLPVVFTTHSWTNTLPLTLRAVNLVTGWLDRKITLSAVSKRVARQMALADSKAAIKILPNGAEYDFWNVVAEQHESPQKEPFQLVSAMRLEWTKRPEKLIHVFHRASRELARRGYSLRLTLAGSGGKRDASERLAAKLGIADQIEFVDWLDHEHLRNLFARSHAFVLASRLEAFGISALEARIAGLPILALNRAGLQDFIIDGTDGILCATDRDLSAAIVDLVQDTARQKHLFGNRSGLARYDWRAISNLHLKTYQNVIAQTAYDDAP